MGSSRNCCALFIFLLVTNVSALADEPARKRLAILASQSVLDDGLVDLLQARLSQDKAIALLERERLATSATELQLAAAMQAANVAERLELGKTSGADVWMVLSPSLMKGWSRRQLME